MDLALLCGAPAVGGPAGGSAQPDPAERRRANSAGSQDRSPVADQVTAPFPAPSHAKADTADRIPLEVPKVQPPALYQTSAVMSSIVRYTKHRPLCQTSLVISGIGRYVRHRPS